MLRGMRKLFDKNQKILLVALAAILVAFFTIPQRSCRGQRPERLIGTLYGQPITVAGYEGFLSRWSRLELPFVRINPNDPNENAPYNTLLILGAARQHGIQVGPDAVTKRLHQDPPMRVRLEYILADPQELAKDIKPSDEDIRAYYDTKWEKKSEKFEDVKDTIRGKIADERAKKMAVDRIAKAHKILAAAPRDAAAWQHASSAAAKQSGLTYGRVPDVTHALVLRLQTGMMFEPAHPLWPLASPLLPEGFADAAFGTGPGELGKRVVPLADELGKNKKMTEIWESGDKRFIFRVIGTSAGIQANGKLFQHDEGWRNGRFMKLKTYPDYETVLKEKRRMDVALARRGFEEYLVVQKFLALACGGASGPALTSSDAREQWAARQSLEVKALLAKLPVAPFIDRSEPDETRLLEFYDVHKKRLPDVMSTEFGYGRPEQVQVEYVTVDLARFGRQIEVSENDIATYYARYKGQEFLADDGETPKPLADVRSDIVKKLTRLRAHSLAAALLKDVKRKAQTPRGLPLPLDEAAAGNGLVYGKSPLFSRGQLSAAVRELAGSAEFAELAFSDSMWPDKRQTDVAERIRPLSPPLLSGDNAFVFRLVTHRDPHSLPYTALSPDMKQLVRSGYAHAAAVEKVKAVARQTKAGVARALVAAIAAENKLSVRTADIQSAGAEATAVPPVLADYVTQQLQSALGGIARLVKDGDTYYTAAITGTNRQTYEVKIDYIRFTEQEFTATLEPDQEAIDERARAIRDAAQKANAEPATDDKPKPEPTKEQAQQAKTELIAEWEKQDFRTRYVTYLGKRLPDVFREHLEANPLKIGRTVTLRQVTTSSFFRADDTFPMGRDPILIEAAFKLKPNELSEVVTGKFGAAVMLLAGEETRTERKVEVVSVDPAAYDALSITVSDADVEKYYEAHPDGFRRPARAKAEFVFASFENVARVIAGSITDKEVEAYYAENATAAYRDQTLDERLRTVIRRVLAQKRAEADAAEQAIGAAYKNAQASPLPLEQTIRALDKLGLIAGTTPDLAATDYTIPAIGLATELVGQIVAADKGKLAEPVRVSSGWAIFRVVEKQPAVMPPLADVMPAARGRVWREQLAARAGTAMEKVRAFLEAHPKATIEEALARPELAADLPFGPSVQTTGFFDKLRAINYPPITAPLSDAIFAAEPGQLTAVVNTGDTVQLARVIEEKTDRLVKVHHVRVAADLYAPMIKISADEARAHYDAHTADENRPQRYELQYLVPDTRAIEAEIEPSEEDVTDAYKRIQHLYPDRASRGDYQTLDAARRQIIDLLKARGGKLEAARLLAKAQELIGKDSKRPLKEIAAELANLKLESVTAYEPGSDSIPWDLRGVAGLDAFIATAKAGETSPVLRAFSGPILVRVTKILPAGPAPFDDVEERIKKDLAIERGLIDATKLAGEVRAKITETTAAGMQAAAAQFQVATAQVEPIRVEETGAVQRDTLRGMAQTISARAREFRERYQQGLSRPMEFASQMRGLRWGLSELLARDGLFRMRPGEIGEPVVTGNRADICSLAVVAELRHTTSAMNLMLGARLGWEARAARLQNLVDMIQADVVQASGAR